ANWPGRFSLETRSIIPNATDGASKIQKNFAARQRLIVATVAALTAGGLAAALGASGSRWPAAISWVCVVVVLTALLRASSALFTAALGEIGRASCRERGWISRA